jgi:hypothetical protein
MFDRCDPAPTFEGAGTVVLALELSGTCWLVALHAHRTLTRWSAIAWLLAPLRNCSP